MAHEEIIELRITLGATGSAAEIAVQQDEQSDARACRITSFPCKEKLKGRKKITLLLCLIIQ